MPSGRNRGLVQTVLGPVPPSELGATTTHEHLYIDFSFMYRPARDSRSPELADAPITLENLGWIRRNYYSNRSNLQLMDLDTATREVRKYSEVGGGAIVDATTTGIGRKPDALAQISRQSGVHIIMGAGFYVEAVHPEDMDERSVEDLAREIIGDIVDGVEGELGTEPAMSRTGAASAWSGTGCKSGIHRGASAARGLWRPNEAASPCRRRQSPREKRARRCWSIPVRQWPTAIAPLGDRAPSLANLGLADGGVQVNGQGPVAGSRPGLPRPGNCLRAAARIYPV